MPSDRAGRRAPELFTASLGIVADASTQTIGTQP